MSALTIGAALTAPDRLVARSAEADDGLLFTLAEEAQRMLATAGVDGDLIVRSSGVSEDGRRSSYAGQFRSVRSQNRTADIVDAIKAVLAAAFEPHVRVYAAHRGEVDGLPAMRMALFLQEYLTLDYGGVLFTHHPVAGPSRWMLVEFLAGDPSDLVSGRVTPARCRLSVDGSRLLWERRDPVTFDIDRGALQELARVGTTMRSILGCEVDVEWGVTGAALVALQCRPVTTTSASESGFP